MEEKIVSSIFKYTVNKQDLRDLCVEQLKVGVDKVAINTIPEAYKRSKWAGKEKFGPTLYEDFKNLKNEFDE